MAPQREVRGERTARGEEFRGNESQSSRADRHEQRGGVDQQAGQPERHKIPEFERTIGNLMGFEYEADRQQVGHGGAGAEGECGSDQVVPPGNLHQALEDRHVDGQGDGRYQPIGEYLEYELVEPIARGLAHDSAAPLYATEQLQAAGYRPDVA